MHEIKQLICQVMNVGISPTTNQLTALIYLPSKHLNLLCHWKLADNSRSYCPYSVLPLDLKTDPVLRSELIQSAPIDYSELALLYDDIVMVIQGSKSMGSSQSQPTKQGELAINTNAIVAYQMFQLSLVHVLTNHTCSVLSQHRLTIPGNGIGGLITWNTPSSVFGILSTSSSCVVIDIPITVKEPMILRQPPRIIWLDDLKSHGQFLGKAFTTCRPTIGGVANKAILGAITTLDTLHLTTFETIPEASSTKASSSSITNNVSATITRSKLIARTTEVTLPVINTLIVSSHIALCVYLSSFIISHYILSVVL